jgi:hypothetical protein
MLRPMHRSYKHGEASKKHLYNDAQQKDHR